VDHAGRRDRLRRVLAESELSGPLLVTDLANVRYLTGFSGSNAVLRLGPAPEDDLLGTDGRYVDQAEMECPDLDTLIDRATLRAVGERTASMNPDGGILVESTLSVSAAGDLRHLGCEPVVVPAFIEEARAVKDADELAVLQRACEITSAAFAALSDEIRVGDTEIGLARRLEQLFGAYGAEDRAFETIVGAGAHSAIPHHQPGPVTLTEGDLLVIDAGARVAGYHADMTRTFVVGRSPQSWQVDLHEAVRAAQSAAIAVCRPGMAACEIDAAARVPLRAAGLEGRFTHGLGHGVGLVIHEAPGISARSTGSIQADMAFTVEPGAYLPGKGGVRIEDTLVVHDAGPRLLTSGSPELRVVGA
jgi:Xaa-Pro dipeptidase